MSYIRPGGRDRAAERARATAEPSTDAPQTIHSLSQAQNGRVPIM